MNTSRRWVLPLSLAAGGLLICLPSVQAAPGAVATVGIAGAAPASGGHAAAAAPVGAVHSAGVANHAPGLAAPGGVRAVPGPAANPGLPGNGYNQRAGVTQTSVNRGHPSVARVRNAWTDPGSSRTVNASGISRGGGYAAAPHRTDPVYTVRPGNHLYNGRYGFRGNHRYYDNNFPYGVYYPYLYNNYGSDGYVGGVADYSGLNTENSVADLGAPDFSNNPNNYYSYVAPEQTAPDADPPTNPSTQPLPDAPTVGPDGPSAANKSAGVAPGPDSLVEAVQTELARRGYFEGKPDSMYSPATREAIRRFQTDQGLPATGRINEATLHALRLD